MLHECTLTKGCSLYGTALGSMLDRIGTPQWLGNLSSLHPTSLADNGCFVLQLESWSWACKEPLCTRRTCPMLLTVFLLTSAHLADSPWAWEGPSHVTNCHRQCAILLSEWTPSAPSQRTLNGVQGCTPPPLRPPLFFWATGMLNDLTCPCGGTACSALPLTVCLSVRTPSQA